MGRARTLGAVAAVCCLLAFVPSCAKHGGGNAASNPAPAAAANGEQLTPLSQGQVWESEDKEYSLRFPDDWKVEANMLGEGVMAKAAEGLPAVFSLKETRTPEKTREAELKSLAGEATRNAPPTMGSTGYKELEQHSGTIDGFPAAWKVMTYRDDSMGEVATMVFAIGTPTTLYVVNAMAPLPKLAELRPTLEGIAGSFHLMKRP